MQVTQGFLLKMDKCTSTAISSNILSSLALCDKLESSRLKGKPLQCYLLSTAGPT